jgi:hypothetical protein
MYGHESSQGIPSLVDDIVASRPGRKSAFSKALFFAAKLIVSGACFWYVLRQMNLTEIIRTLPTFDVRWAAFAVSVAMAPREAAAPISRLRRARLTWGGPGEGVEIQSLRFIRA